MLQKNISEKTDHQKVFTDIYINKIWGGNSESEFYSGSGSDDDYSKPYIDLISNFIKHNNISSVVDLGCGDFRVGRSLIEATDINYIGVDVVEELINFNTSNYGSDKIVFKKLNIVHDSLPSGQLCLIRQVLQHLSNNDIKRVLRKLNNFDYVIVTEHLPCTQVVVPNIDLKNHAGIRLMNNSGVYLDKAPFNKKTIELLSVYPKLEENSRIVTFQVFV
ncbi:class I SAM-dependent methyltransferase [Pontibacter sp. MBLB2868]|uniref:class I SAM-dependent methyltransferase n=1 Tax=Pontibacter sp. MBLB2868 TaxID=3451555 RepID=UPI003F74FE12